MRKIRRISHLRKEQTRLQQRRAELEDALRNDWKTIRQTLQPATLAREALVSGVTWIGDQLLSKWLPVKKSAKKHHS